MADAGGGSYRFVGNPEELPTVIAAELEPTTRTFARQPRVRVHLAEGNSYAAKAASEAARALSR
jgi:hypothetical protein